MNKFIVIFLIFLLFCSDAGAEKNALDVKSNDFAQFGRYVQTLEFNEPAEKEEIKKKDEFEDIEFELKAAEELRERYEASAVRLKPVEADEEAVLKVNNSRLFKIKVNEEQYRIENAVKNENMIWDSSKNYKISALFGRRFYAPIPSVVNSSRVTSISPSGLRASYGQVSLHDSVGTSVLFMRANESTYNTGTVLAYTGGKIKASAGAFTSSYNHASSGGLILSSKETALPFGEVSFGGAFGAKEESTYDKASSGLFGQYKFKRLKLNVQIASVGYSDARNHETGLYFVPELQLTESLSVKTRFIRNVTLNTMQDELVLSYSPKKTGRNLSLELNASNYRGDKTSERQRIKFSASFKI